MNLCLKMMGSRWVSYPSGIRFPAGFSKVYPFRGRGVVSNLLYFLHKIRVDRLLLLKEDAPLPFEDVAWFWPSPARSVDRFYGYRIVDGSVSGYLKVAKGESAISRLDKEVKNVRRVLSHSPRTFKTPACLGCRKLGDFLVAEFEPMPLKAQCISDSPELLEKVRVAREEIASFGYAHGDFMPHNIRIADEVLWIIDWEELMTDTSRFIDDISFETAFRFFIRKESLKAICMWVKRKYLSGAETMRAEAIIALHSMEKRNVGLGKRILESLNQIR